MSMSKESIEKLIDKVNVSIISSIDESGFPNSKPMLPPRKREGISTYYFTTNTSSMRVKQYSSNNKSRIYFYDKRFFRGLMPEPFTIENNWHVSDCSNTSQRFLSHSLFQKTARKISNRCKTILNILHKKRAEGDNITAAAVAIGMALSYLSMKLKELGVRQVSRSYPQSSSVFKHYKTLSQAPHSLGSSIILLVFKHHTTYNC